MQIFNDKKQRVGTLKGFKDRKIVKTLDSGDRELSFKYPSDGEMVDLLKEENYIRTKEDEYVIRKRKTGAQFNEYTAQLNVEELEGAVFPYGFESKEQTIRACLEFAFEGTGWKVGTSQITKKRTINKDEETNAWEILQDCLSTYRVECKINSLTKTIDIYEQIGADRGRYFIEGLNLKKLTVTSDTYDFYTRLIPLGKDGIGIEWLGKPYLENYQYSSKIKTYVWSDERYTNTTSLIEDGIAKLDEMSKPYVAYTADVIDLARQSEKYSNVFDFDIGDTVWMISKKTHTKEKQRIVKLTEYPEAPRSNTVELSNTTKTFAEVQQEATDQAKSEAIKIANSSAKKVLEDRYYTKTEVETHIAASKEEIELGASKVYETKTIVDQKIKSANDLTDEKLTEYSTTKQMNAAIKVQAEAIDLSVSKTYETKTTVTEKIKSANELAQSAADTAEENANANLESYKKVANAAIELNANAIKSKVTADEVTSQIEQSAEAIRCQAKKISWKSDSSEMTEDGLLTCKGASIEDGNIICQSDKKNPRITLINNKVQMYASAYNLSGKNEDGINTLTIGNSESGFVSCYSSGGYTERKYGSLGFNGVSTTDGSKYSNLSPNGLWCTGSKHRVVRTQDYGERLLCCYETPSPMFGDVGSAQTDETGKCIIFVDEKFAQTIDTEYLYDVFLTKYGLGDCYVSERTPAYFTVEGTKNLKFAWEIKTIQRDYENLRLEEYTHEKDDTDSLYNVSAYMNTLLYQLD